MKRFFLFLTLGMITLSTGFSQEEGQKVDSSDAFINISAGLTAWTDLNIRDNLREMGANDFSPVSPTLGVGFIATPGPLQVDFQLQFALPKKSTAGSVGYQLYGMSDQLDVRYRLFKIGHKSIYGGAILAMQFWYLNLYSQNAKVDLTSPPDQNSFGTTNLYSANFLLGPTLATGNLINSDNATLQVAASYGFNIINGRWRSQHTTVIHASKEPGSSFSLSLIFGFMKF